MDSWTDGYVSEIPYVNRFYPELTPQLMRFALRWQGYDAPTTPYRYCELGSGFGLSVNINAAANPTSEFVGVDFLTEHTKAAQSLAHQSQTRNAIFLDDSFEQFQQRDIQPFDFICLHGVLSWVNDENRNRVIELIRDRLNPGGVVYVSFNCLPGRSPSIPLRDLLWFHQENSDAPIVDRINNALQFASDLYETQSGFFADNKGFERSLQAMKGENRSVLAHEYFNRDWKPMYFAQVASELQAANVSFASPVSLIDQYDGMTVPPAAQEQLAKTTDPALRETVLDFLVNRQFRRDLFGKELNRLSTDNLDRMLDERFALMIARRELKLKHTMARGDLQLEGKVHEPIVEALARRPMTLREIIAQPAVAQLPSELTMQALTIAVGIGYIQPAMPTEGLDLRRASTDRFNQTVFAQARQSAANHVLASPVTGGGVRVNNFEAMYLSARHAKKDPVTATWDALQKQSRRMTRDGVQLVSDADNLSVISEEYQMFADHKLPVLEQLGVA